VRESDPPETKERTMAPKKLTVTARLSHWTSTDGTRGANLDITDQVSGVTMLRIEITPADFYRLMSGAATENIDTEVYGLDRLGQVRDWKTVTVPTEYEDYKYRDGAVPDRVRNHPVPEGYEYAGARRNNQSQWLITFDRWFDPTPEQRQERLDRFS
jgi:hypothetical protein